jgi:hypothetical protein
MAMSYNDLNESLYILKNKEAKSRTMWNRLYVPRELSYVYHSAGTQGIYNLRGTCHLFQRLKHFDVGKSTRAIHIGNLSLAYYSKYVEKKVQMTCTIMPQ